MIAIICSQCNEGILGLDDKNCTFTDYDLEICSRHFFTLTPVGWSPVKFQSVIECPKCKSSAIIVDIHRVWREEKERLNKWKQF